MTQDNPDFEIISVDWNRAQTAMWAESIAKHNNRKYSIYTIPDTSLVPGIPGWMKINCFRYPFETDRVLYMDTDTLVTGDLWKIFEEMDNGGHTAGFTAIPGTLGTKHGFKLLGREDDGRYVSEKSSYGKMSRYWPAFCNDIGLDPCELSYWTSGVIAFNKYPIMHFYHKAMEMKRLVKEKGYWPDEVFQEEIVLSAYVHKFILPKDGAIWRIPREIHGLLDAKKKDFGTATKPLIIHYHNMRRLRRHGLWK